MGDFGNTKDKWVCPNDRELCLRAKLNTGWSVKTNAANSFGALSPGLNDAEQEAILSVIRKAECLERIEQERVGRLVDRLDNMKKNAMGNGSTQCVLCADEFGILGASPLSCCGCKKAVCTKCGVDTVSIHKEPLWLCKICAETRETWKKSGAWFYKGLPKYVLPGRKQDQGKHASGRNAESARSYAFWLQSKGKAGSDREYTDSSDDEFKSSRLLKKSTPVKKPYSDSGESNEASLGAVAAPNETTEGGPSPSNMQSFSVDQRSPRDTAVDSPRIRSPAPDVLPSSKEKRESPSPGHWYKPSVRQPDRSSPDSQEPRRTHQRKDCHSPAARQRSQGAVSRSEASEERAALVPSEESSTLEFSLLFDAHNQVLHCTIYRAKGLHATDIDGLADPYVRLHLLPVQSKMDKMRTRTVHKTLKPEFNEAVSFYGISDYDIAKRTLRMTVMDEDTHCHEPLGEVRIALKKLRPQQPSYANLYLEKPRPDENEEDTLRGQILVSLVFSEEHSALVVGIVRCVRLPSRDGEGSFPDPFVKIQMKPDPLRRRFKTLTKKKTLNPEYNEQYVFELEPRDMTKKTLEVTVWDKENPKSEAYIGGLALNMQSKADRLRHWLDASSNPERRVERWHPLSNVVFID